MSILFSKEVAETLLLFANLRVKVRELEGIWRLDYLFRELPMCCESQPSLQRGRYLCVACGVVWCGVWCFLSPSSLIRDMEGLLRGFYLWGRQFKRRGWWIQLVEQQSGPHC